MLIKFEMLLFFKILEMTLIWDVGSIYFIVKIFRDINVESLFFYNRCC